MLARRLRRRPNIKTEFVDWSFFLGLVASQLMTPLVLHGGVSSNLLSVGLMLNRRRRRRANIKSTLGGRRVIVVLIPEQPA